MVAKAIKMYSIKWYVNGVVKSEPIVNRPFALCNWWVQNNKQNFTIGKLIIEAIKEY